MTAEKLVERVGKTGGSSRLSIDLKAPLRYHFQKHLAEYRLSIIAAGRVDDSPLPVAIEKIDLRLYWGEVLAAHAVLEKRRSQSEIERDVQQKAQLGRPGRVQFVKSRSFAFELPKFFLREQRYIEVPNKRKIRIDKLGCDIAGAVVAE